MTINQDVADVAKWVAEKLGVDWRIIYAQWSLEAGPEGINNPASKNYNLGGLTVRGKVGEWRSYPSLWAFGWDYLNSFLLPNYPGTHGAKNIDQFVEGLQKGKSGSYFGSESAESYSTKLKARYNSLFGAGSSVIDFTNDLNKWRYGSDTEREAVEEKRGWNSFNITDVGSFIQSILIFTLGAVLLILGVVLMMRKEDDGSV